MMAIPKFVSLVYTFPLSWRYVHVTVNLTFSFECLKGISAIICLKWISFISTTILQGPHRYTSKQIFCSLHSLIISLISVNVTILRRDHEMHAWLFLVSHLPHPKYQDLLVLHPKCIPNLSTLPNLIRDTSITHCNSILSCVCVSSPSLSTCSIQFPPWEALWTFTNISQKCCTLL